MPVKSNVVEFRRRAWSATANLSVSAQRSAYRAHGQGMLALVEASGQLDAAATTPAVDLAELRDELSRYRDFFERAPVGFLVMDLSGRIERANRAAAAILRSGKAQPSGHFLRDFCSERSVHQAAGHIERLAAGASFDLCEIEIERPGEQPLPVRIETLNLGAAQDGPLRAILLDAADLEELEEGLCLAASVVEHTAQAVIVTDAQCRTIAVNPAFTAITGYTATEMLGHTPSVLLQAGATEDPSHLILSQLRAHGYWQGESTNRRKDGSTYLELAQVNAIPDATGSAKYYVCMLSDMTGQDAAKNALIQLAYSDSLTGLANRVSLLDHLRQGVIAARRDKHPLGLLYLDLDKFKEVNDQYGHGGGDHLLQYFAATLKASVRNTDLVARIGGDEFAIVMPHLAAEAAARRVAGKILRQLDEVPFRAHGRDIRVGASIGITLFPKDGTDLETLLNCADSAMYEAKKAGGNRCRFYTPQTSPDFKQHGQLQSDLRHALHRRELVIQYQPRVRLRDLRIIGCEAILGWNRPGHGLLDPRTFASLVATTGWVVPFQQWLMSTALAEAQQAGGGGFGNLRVAFSVAVPQLGPDAVEPLVRQIAAAVAAQAFAVELELPESVAAGHTQSAAQTLARVREQGAQLTLRGFGSDAVSLGQIASLPLTRVKIEPSLLQGLEANPATQALLNG
ncbi:MAG TPA: diguanylate cyclase, partial [Lamprocystis sp. (in: g-proteobacteria)]|nr:diguanylate cyclase [Lamprocystis sp. (in: g-proteobacteria)]